MFGESSSLGGIISRGPGLSMVEATSVTAEGRITPEVIEYLNIQLVRQKESIGGSNHNHTKCPGAL